MTKNNLIAISTFICISIIGFGPSFGGSVTYTKLARAPGDRSSAVQHLLAGTSRVFWETGRRVSIYYLGKNGSAIRAQSGMKKLRYGRWSVTKGPKPRVCFDFRNSGRNACYSLTSKSLDWQAGACEGNKFGLSTKSSLAPKEVAGNRNPMILIKMCRRLSANRVREVRRIAGLD